MSTQAKGRKDGWTFAQVPIEMLMEKELSDGAKVVFSYLAFRQGHDENSWPSLKRIAEDVGTSQSTARRRVQELAGRGWLTVTQREGHSNLYTIHAEKQAVTPASDDTPNRHDTPTPANNERGTPTTGDTHNNSQGNKRQKNNISAVPSEADVGAASGEKEKARELSDAFTVISGIRRLTPRGRKDHKAQQALWWNPLYKLLELTDNDVEMAKRLIVATVKRMRNDGLTISNPNSLLNVAADVWAKHVKAKAKRKPKYRTVRTVDPETGEIVEEEVRE